MSHSISIQRIRTLSLPIPLATSIATLFLPLIIGLGLSLKSGQSLARGSFLSTSDRISWTAVAIFLLFTICETIIVTLSVTYMAPASALTCPLEQRWQQLFSDKDGNAIKRIQDAHRCCGLHSAVDRAWPFPGENRAVTACREMLSRVSKTILIHFY